MICVHGGQKNENAKSLVQTASVANTLYFSFLSQSFKRTMSFSGPIGKRIALLRRKISTISESVPFSILPLLLPRSEHAWDVDSDCVSTQMKTH